MDIVAIFKKFWVLILSDGMIGNNQIGEILREERLNRRDF